MAIIKPGFTPGFRGRMEPPEFGERAHYLTKEHGRHGVLVFNQEHQGLTEHEVCQFMGGNDIVYQEIIVSPSNLECEAIKIFGKKPDDHDSICDMAKRLSESYAKGDKYVTAIHWKSEELFHFHITIQRKEPANFYGETRESQKVWRANWFKPQHNVTDWEEYANSKRLQQEAAGLAKEVRRTSDERKAELRRSPDEQKIEVFSKWKETEKGLSLKRHEVELQAIESRYRCRSIPDSILKKIEIEKAQSRYQKHVNELDREEKRIIFNDLYDKASRDLAWEYGKLLRSTPMEDRAAIRTECWASQEAIVGRITQAELGKAQKEHLLGSNFNEEAYLSKLEQCEQQRQAYLKMAEERFKLQEIQIDLKESRNERNTAYKKAGTNEEREAIKERFEEQHKDLYKAYIHSKIEVVEQKYLVYGMENSEACKREKSAVSEQAWKEFGKSIKGEQFKQTILDLKVEMQALGDERRELYRAEQSAGRMEAIERINERERALSKEIMVSELVALKEEFEGKAERSEWRNRREAVIEKAFENDPVEVNTGEEPKSEEKEPEEGKTEGTEEETLEHTAQAWELGEEGKAVEAYQVEHEEPEARDRPKERWAQEEHSFGGTGLMQPSPDWPEELQAAFLERVRGIEAVYSGIQERQELEPAILEKQQALKVLMEETKAALKEPGSDKEGLLQAFTEKATALRDDVLALQIERMDSRFRPHSGDYGIGSERHEKALLELRSRASLQAVREDISIETAALYARRTEALKAARRQIERDCLGEPEAKALLNQIHQAADARLHELAVQMREEEHRHYTETLEGQEQEREEAQADERMEAALERIVIDQAIRAVREEIQSIKAEMREPMAQEGADRKRIAEKYFKGELGSKISAKERLEFLRLDTYYKGQPEGRGIGSERHTEAKEGLAIQQECARKREELQTKLEICRLDRHEFTAGLSAPGDRERREALYTEFDAKEKAIAAELREMDRRGIEHACEAGTPEFIKAMEDLDARYGAIEDRQRLDCRIREVKDAVYDLREQAILEIGKPGADRSAILQEHKADSEALKEALHGHQVDRLRTLFAGQQEDRALSAEEHYAAWWELKARQELQTVREAVSLERQAVNLDRLEALALARVKAKQDLMSQEETRQQREEVHARFDLLDLALADRTLEAEKIYADRTTEEGTRQQEREMREAEERRQAVAARCDIEKDLRLCKDLMEEIKRDRSEALALEGADRAAVLQKYETLLETHQREKARLEAAKLETYYRGQPEGRGIGSELHNQALQALQARHAILQAKDDLALEQEILWLDRRSATRHINDPSEREAIHQSYDAKERALAQCEAELSRQYADNVFKAGSEEHTQALSQADAKLKAVSERQELDRLIRGLDDRIEEIRTKIEQPGTNHQATLEVHREAIQEIRQESKDLQTKRLDLRFQGEDPQNSQEHQEARAALQERLEHQAAMEDLSMQRAVLAAEKREALEKLQASFKEAQEVRELTSHVPQIGGVLHLATKPNTEKQTAEREALHRSFEARERRLAEEALKLEKAHLERTLKLGTKEHSRALDLAQRKYEAVEKRQAIDRELRRIRDRVQEIRQETRKAEQRLFANRVNVRTEAQAKMDQQRDRAMALEHQRQALLMATREPIRMDSPEGRAHQEKVEASKAHLTKDQELRREVDRAYQAMFYARTDYQESYKKEFFNRWVIQREYKAQELEKVDRIHSLELARIDASHTHSGTHGTKSHQEDLAQENKRHQEARKATESRDLGRSLSAMELYGHTRNAASMVINGVGPDEFAKRVLDRASKEALNATLELALGEYAVIAKTAKRILPM